MASSLKIYTAGYGNLGFEAFLARLRTLGTTHLVDVRRVPGSKHWVDFCRPRIDDLINESGIRYIWMGDTIGGLGDRDIPLDENGFRDYRSVWMEPPYQIGLDKVVQAASKPGWSICLMCGCLRPQTCHRGTLLGPALLERGIELIHIETDGTPVPHRAAMLNVQESLFTSS